MSATKRCWTCGEDRPRENFTTNFSRRCTPCHEKILRSARCGICGMFSGLKVNGWPRLICDRDGCQSEQRSRAVRKALEGRRARMDSTRRTCSVCTLTKPLDEEHFYVTVRGEDGEPLRFDAYCQSCKRADQKARYHGDPKRKAADRARAKRQRERIRKRREKDPAFDRDYRKRSREYERKRRARRHGQTEPETTTYLVDTERSPSLPPAPLIDKLRERERMLAADDVAATREALAEVAGCSVRQLWRWLDAGEGGYVRFDVVDRALLGLDLLWFEVWDPDEYPEAAEVFEGEKSLAAA